MALVTKVRINYVARPLLSKGPLDTNDYNSSVQEASVDLISLGRAWNSYAYPILYSLPRGSDESRWGGASDIPDAITDGLHGDTIFVDNEATATSDDGVLWSSIKLRPLTVKESIIDLHGQLADAIEELETQIDQTPVRAEFLHIRAFIGKDAEGNNRPGYLSTNYISNSTSLETAIGTLDEALNDHENLTNNPHGVTLAQVGGAKRRTFAFSGHTDVSVPIEWNHGEGVKWPLVQVYDTAVGSDYGAIVDGDDVYETEHGIVTSTAFISVESISPNILHVYTDLAQGIIVAVF